MANSKISDLTADTSPSSSDLVETVKDPGGTPLSRKATLLNVLKGAVLGLLTSDGDLLTRASGVAARVTRASLAADSAFTAAFAALNGAGTVLAVKLYEPGADGVIASSTSSTFADVDATNAVVTFTVPPSGKVLVEASALCRNDTQGGTCRLNLRESTSDLAGTDMRTSAQADTANQDEVRAFYCAYVTSLTPGASKTYKLGIARDGSTGAAQVRGGPGLGPLIMKVIAAP